MELTEFAERILVGTSLEDKLACPSQVVDSTPSARAIPEFPGRPPELRIDGPRRTVPFPGLSEDATDETRGTAMHFFANHELLAIELMAVFLLRFPDAPPALRKAILHTITEEQEHMRLYTQRMGELGVTLGHVPVSRFFWDCLSDMRSPTEYLAGMSLTLEQANLDFSAHYLERFQAIGDERSAQVLQRVYDDEIGHVKLGVLWMDRLKSPDDARALWPRYTESLRAPLTPARGRTSPFDQSGRVRAGLPAEFVDQVRVFRHSKGRDPSVFWFNPGSEAAWAVSPNPYQPKRAVITLQEDLEVVPLFFASSDDVVVVSKTPRLRFLASLLDAGFELPEFTTSVDDLADRPLGRLRPWAWSPDSVAAAHTLSAARIPEEPRDVFSKAWSAELLRDLIAAASPERKERWCTLHSVGTICAAPSEVEEALNCIRRTDHRAVIKSGFGTAGRGMVREFSTADIAPNMRWVRRVMSTQDDVVVEPWLDRVLDLSVQLDVAPSGEITLLGVTRFVADQRGQYRATSIGPWIGGVDEPLRRFIVGTGRGPWWVIRELEWVARFVGQRLADAGHQGPAGIDALLYRDKEGAYRLKPIVEVNPRFTMGHVALRVAKHVAPGVSGMMEILSVATLRESGCSTFAEYATHQPPVEVRTRSGRLLVDGGVLWLTDPERARSAALVLRIDG